MNQTDDPTRAADRETRRRRMLTYGVVVSLIGIPVGILLKQPVVWGLAILGIVVGGIKMVRRGIRRP